MTAREFNRLLRRMGAAAMEQESSLVEVYRRALAAMGRYYVEQFEAQAVVASGDWIPPAGAPPFDSSGVLEAARLQREEAAEAIEKVLLAGLSAPAVAISFDPDRFRVFSPDLLDSLAQHADANFDAAGRETLGQVIRESFDAGLSVPHTANAMRERFSSLSKSAATMLARTDLISLANGGSYMAARQVFEGRSDVGKSWLNTHDARTRPTHVEAGGQVVPLDAPFRVGGFDLMYPGDPQGPPGEVINCRCTFTTTDAMTASAATREGEMAATEIVTGTRWRSVLVLEGVETDDGRLIDPGALDWRELPLTLMGMTETGPGGHEGAEVAGRIDAIARNSATNEVIGEGVFDAGEFGAEIARMVGDEVLRGVSVDLAIREYELRSQRTGQEVDPYEEPEDEDDRIIFAVTDASIMGATVCPFPAFADANIELIASGEGETFTHARVVMPFALIADEEALALEEGEQGIADGSLGETLRRLFADTATMGSTARGYHFGSQVPVQAFEAIYRDLIAGADLLAEQALAVGARPVVGLEEVVALRSFADGSDAVATFDMAATLRQQNELLLRSLNAAFVEAAAAEQPGVADVLSRRIERHQRWAVLLRGLMAA